MIRTEACVRIRVPPGEDRRIRVPRSKSKKKVKQHRNKQRRKRRLERRKAARREGAR